MQVEIIKKTIKQKTKTIVVGDNSIEIVPDTDAVYATKILLKKRDVDLGFFDALTQRSPYYTPYSFYSDGGDIGLGESLILDENFI